MWSPATAPFCSLETTLTTASHIDDPYSIENFNPSRLQYELRQTYLPFINITDEYFLSEHEHLIAANPRLRSSITKDENDTNASHDNDDDEFYFLLSSLYDIRTKIDQLTNEYDVLQRKIAFLLPHVWSFSCEKIEAGSYCGDNVYLKRSILYEQANFDRNLSKEIDDTLKQLRTIIYQQYVALKYETLWYKMKIDIYIFALLSTNHTSKKLLHTIEVLFNFQRYRTRDELFYSYTRHLLKQTIDVVYKYGNYNETLFLVNHVLRCPPGIHQWATSFVRFLLPTSFEQLCSPIYIRYVAHFLATLLFPIKNRDIFLANWLGEHGETIPQRTTSSTDTNQQQQWMLIDADGQERAALLRWDTLNEDDLIALLNQFNLKYLMKMLFNLTDRTATCEHEQRTVSYENTVRILALLDLFVEILCRGFDTYADSQYKTFHKHIGKMIR
jgi:ectopic P granules protein 5